MRVELLASTPNALNVIYTACRTCYSSSTPSDIYKEEVPREKQWKLIKEVMASGHLSTVEHVSFTFAIEGVSRALSHQLVRHRHASFSQQSQRYVEFDPRHATDGFVFPPSIERDEETNDRYSFALGNVMGTYSILTGHGILAEDARMILPNATTTNIVMTLNLRELIHICNLRLCTQAQWEIRNLVKQMRDLVIEQYPEFAEYLVPKCQLLGYCDETRKTCHRMPTKKEVLDTYQKYKGME